MDNSITTQEQINEAIQKQYDPIAMATVVYPRIQIAIEQAKTPKELNILKGQIETVNTYLRNTLPKTNHSRKEQFETTHKMSMLYCRASAQAGILWNRVENKQIRGLHSSNGRSMISIADAGFMSSVDATRCSRIGELFETDQEDWRTYEEETRDKMQQPTVNGLEQIWILINKTTKEVMEETPKILISAYGENIYFNSGVALESRWDDHIIDSEVYPTLTRIGRFFHKDGTQFSLREYARVQDFPDTYKFVGTYSEIKSQIGNAVSPKMAEYIGRELQGKTFIDLFAGCGGLSCGLTRLGKQALWANEYEASYFQTYIINHEKTKCTLKNVFDVRIDEIPDADVIVGGPPCQGFSTAGLRMRNDPRNKLYQQFLRIVDGKRPHEFLMENVVQIAEIKDQIIEDFEKIGYKTELQIIKGEEIGMKQRRHRAFFIGRKL